jgi:hypothetical protein
MKCLFNKILCLLFLHDFYDARVTDHYIEVRCHRCPGKWRVDNKLHVMEVV